MKWPNKKYKIGENHLCRSVFFCHADFADATCPVVADTPWDWKKSHRFHRFTQIFSSEFFVPQISQIYTDIYWDVFFCHADFADDADFFSWDFLFIGFHGIYSEVDCWDDYSRIFADATCPVVADTPWDWTKRFTRDSIKNLCISVKSVGQNPSHEEKSASSAKSAWPKQQEHI